MIDTLYLANQIQEQLNNNSLGMEFLVFADEGDLVKTQKKGNIEKRYVNALLDTISSNIVPIKSISFQTINTQLTVLVDLVDAGFVEEGVKKRKQSRNLLNVKQCIEELTNTINGQTIILSDEGKSYTVSISMSRETVGQKMSIGEMYDCVPVYISISFALFENGVNANDCKIIVNNEDIYFTRFVVTKVKQADQSEFANTKGGKSYMLVGGKSLDIVVPTTNSIVGKFIMQDILENNELNKAVSVRIETPLHSHNFIGVLGTGSVNADINANLGYNISVVEGVEHLLTYGDGWKVENRNENTVSYNMLSKGTIYWGDGTSDYADKRQNISHTYIDGLPSHNIRIFGGV